MEAIDALANKSRDYWTISKHILELLLYDAQGSKELPASLSMLTMIECGVCAVITETFLLIKSLQDITTVDCNALLLYIRSDICHDPIALITPAAVSNGNTALSISGSKSSV